MDTVNNNQLPSLPCKVIIGLGNPGAEHYQQRHSIGFRVVDMLAKRWHGTWIPKRNYVACKILVHTHSLTLVKSLTYMNNTGTVCGVLKEWNVKPEELLVVHDELELNFGILRFRFAGSAKGHNGLRSIIASIGEDFWRLRVGIGRPTERSTVPHYVLTHFDQTAEEMADYIGRAVNMIEEAIARNCAITPL